MIRSISTRLVLAAVLALGISAATAAQEATLEGTDWHLTGYLDGDQMVTVPWYAHATLRLEDGTAQGVGGCNGFGATYELESDRLAFGAPGHTDVGCPEEILHLEEAYLAALPQVTEWATDSGASERTLYLRDEGGNDLLMLTTSAPSLTSSDISALAAELDELRTEAERHEKRIDAIRIGTLRDRIKALEAQVATLSAEPADPDALDLAERVLLEAIPASIAESCLPRRSDNPTGTVAALQCKPDDAIVRDMAYYLMSEERAWKTWRQRMREWGVRDDGKSCWSGDPGQSVATGSIDSAGCYVDANGRANLRYAAEVTNCRQLDAGDTHLKRPAVYIAVLGEDDDIAALTQWAEPREWAGGRDLVVPIERPEGKWDPSCPR